MNANISEHQRANVFVHICGVARVEIQTEAAKSLGPGCPYQHAGYRPLERGYRIPGPWPRRREIAAGSLLRRGKPGGADFQSAIGPRAKIFFARCARVKSVKIFFARCARVRRSGPDLAYVHRGDRRRAS